MRPHAVPDVSTNPHPFSLPGTGPMTQRGAPPYAELTWNR